MIYAGILAGGIGRRMQRVDLPKQFLMLGEKPIILHTIEQFLIHPKINETMVAVPKEWVAYTNDLIKKHLPQAEHLHVLAGGAERNDSLMCMLDYIETQWSLQDNDIIVSHDAIRPFVTQRIISDNIAACEICDAVDTVVPAYDTIVHSKDGSVITDIPVRGEMFQGQTPQTFRATKLKELYTSLNDDMKKVLTDAAKIFVVLNNKVALVQGDFSNMKITTPYDLKVANALIEEIK